MMKRVRKRNNSGQVWIETVIYTLIAFVMIGLVLAYARPKIEELQDRAIIEQSIGMLKEIDSTILTMSGAGNQRIFEMGIKKGSLKIDSINDRIIFEMESKNVYSEPDKEISDGSVKILTEKKAGYSLVTLTLDYNGVYNIKFDGKDEEKTISKASISYKLSVLNEGEDAEGRIILNMQLI
jgi:hypothetical protein